MLTLTFTLTQWSTIAHALRTAAATYEDLSASQKARGNQRLAEQFHNQALTVLPYAERIETEVGV